MTRRRALIVAVVVLVPIAAHAVWDQAEAILLAREVRRIADRGEPVNLTAQEFVLATAEQRKAARFYVAAANLASAKHADDSQLWSHEREVERDLPPEQLDAWWRTFVEGEPAFDLLTAAAPLDFAGFGRLRGDLYENASPLVELASLNGLRTDILTSRGDYRQGALALRDTLRLQRTIVRQFYRTTAASRCFGSLGMLLRRAPPDAEVLRDLQRAFEELTDTDTLPEQLRLERARLLGSSWPYTPGSMAWAYRLRVAPPSRGVFEAFALLLLRPVLTRITRAELPLFVEAIHAAERPWPDKIEAARALGPGLAAGRGKSFLSWRSAPPRWAIGFVQAVLPLAGQELAMRRTAVATLAAERYRRAHFGAPPPSLEALVPDYLPRVPQDPFSGKPLVYRQAADGYVIYSVDRNRVDDGGVLQGFGSGRAGMRPPARDRYANDLGIRIPLK